MPRFDPVQTNFTGGEFSPRLKGNFQLDKYRQGVQTLENIFVQPHGGVSRRGGSKYVAEVKDSSKDTILIEFNYKNEFFYILEFGNLYIRFFRDQAAVMDNGSPYEVVTTYTEAELRDIRFTYDEDTLYIVHKDHLPAQLTRADHDDWTLANISFSSAGVATVDTIVEPTTEVWTEQTSSADNSWTAICWSPELELFVAVAQDGTNRVMTSSDGENWTTRIPPDDNNWYDVCWSPDLGLFAAVSYAGTANRVMTSPDGINWTARAATTTIWTGICWSPKLGLFCAVASIGAQRVMTSDDGVTWTNRSHAEDSAYQSVCWSPDLELFIAVASSGTNRVMTSPDGTTWTARAHDGANQWNDVCWSEELTLAVAVSVDDDGSGQIMTSPNGTTWTQRSTPTELQWWSICWSAEMGLFCCVAIDGTANGVMVSSNGTSWSTDTPANDRYWYDVAWSPELNIFCSVAATGTGDRVMTGYYGLVNGSYTDIALTGGSGSGCLATVAVVSNAISTITVTTAGTLYVINDTLSIDPLLIGGNTGPITCDVATLTTGDIPSDWGSANYPTLVWFFEQRAWYAATPDEPNKVWGSRTADYTNLYTGIGLADEGIEIEVKEAKKFLWVTTSEVILLGGHNAEFRLSANNLNEAITPTNIRAPKVTSYGSAFLPAIDIDGNTVFIQRGLRKIRRLEYDFRQDRYKATDISIFSEHIAESGIVDVAYLNEPSPFIFGVRNDGVLVCLTYEPEFDVFGWSRHLIGGTDVVLKSIAVSDAITADEDELWMVVSRTVDGSTVQYVEFLTQGLTAEDAIEDAFFIDSGVTKLAADTNMITNGDFSVNVVGWTPDNSASLFAVPSPPGKEGKCMRVLCNGEDDPGATQEITVVAGGGYTIEGYVRAGEPSTERTYRAYVWDVDNTGILVDTGELEELAEDWSTKFTLEFEAPAGCTTVRLYLVLVALADDATAIWYDSIYMSEKIITFDGLDHIEGETVGIFADGAVQTEKVVSSGEITLDTPAYLAHVGLPYDSILETLPLEGGNPIGSAHGKIKRISKLVLRLFRSLSFDVIDPEGTSNEEEYPLTTLFTGDTEEIECPTGFDSFGTIRLSTTDPVPFTLLAIMYEARTQE